MQTIYKTRSFGKLGRAIFFFFLLSIAQQIGSEPPPTLHMSSRDLSFAHDVRNFGDWGIAQ